MFICSLQQLTPAERGYAQITKEKLAIVFKYKFWQQLLVIRQVVLSTNYKPHPIVFKPDVATSQTALQHYQRWSLFLATFNYIVEHRPGKFNF